MKTTDVANLDDMEIVKENLYKLEDLAVSARECLDAGLTEAAGKLIWRMLSPWSLAVGPFMEATNEDNQRDEVEAGSDPGQGRR